MIPSLCNNSVFFQIYFMNLGLYFLVSLCVVFSLFLIFTLLILSHMWTILAVRNI